MGWEILAPVAKWGFLVIGALAGFFGKVAWDRRQAKKAGRTEAELKILKSAEKERQDADEDIEQVVDRLRERLRRKRAAARVPGNDGGVPPAA